MSVSKRIALLIDGENISSMYIDKVIEEVSKHGTVTYKRIYGDWKNIIAHKWEGCIRENAITPRMQLNNTTGKNASDFAMIIDAMDILYTNDVEGFCLVTSDGDFTSLAGRLRESGKLVIGMGEDKTPKAFRKGCSIFTNLNILEDGHDGDTGTDKNQIEKAIIDIIIENENKGKITHLGELGSRLVNKYPDFDVRNYGYSLLSKFLEEIPSLVIQKQSNQIRVTLADNKALIDQFIRDLLHKSTNETLELGQLGNLVHQEFKDFNVKDYGYSAFSKFVQSIQGIKVSRDNRRASLV